MEIQKYVGRALLAATLAGAMGCASGSGGRVGPFNYGSRNELQVTPASSNTGTATLVRAQGIDMSTGRVSYEALQSAVSDECGNAVVGPFYNTSGGKEETILACDNVSGSKYENRWKLNISSICRLGYRENILPFGDDELYIVTREGNAFSLYMGNDAAQQLGAIIQAYLPENAPECVDVAQNEIAMYHELGPLQGEERVRAQQQNLAYFEQNGGQRFAYKKGEAKK